MSMRPNNTMLAAAASLIMAGCAVGPENCDALDAGSVFRAGACVATGGYEQRIAMIRSETAARVERVNLSDAEAAGLRQEARRLSADRAAYQRRLDELDRDVAGLRARIASTQAHSDEAQAQLDVLRERLDDAERTLALAESADTPTPDEIARLTQEVEQRKKAVAQILETIVRE